MRRVGWARGVWALVVGLWGPAALQAGMIAPPPPLPMAGRVEAESDADGGRVLDQALRGDIGAGQRRLDLLLDLQRGAAGLPAPADLPSRAEAARRPAARAAPPAASAPALPPVAVPAALATLREALRGDEVDGFLAGATQGQVRSPEEPPPDGRGAAVDPGNGVGVGGGGAATDGALAWVLELPRELAAYLREHLGWLIGGGVFLLLLAGVIRLADRRV